MASRLSPEWWGPGMELSEPWGGHRLALLFWLVFHPFPTHGRTLLDALRCCSAFARSLITQILLGCDVFLAVPMSPSVSSERRWVFPSSLFLQHLLLASIRAPWGIPGGHCFSQWTDGPWGQNKGWFIVSSPVSAMVPGKGSFAVCWIKKRSP